MSQTAEPNTAPSIKSRTKRKPSTLRFYGDEFVFDTASGLFYRLSPTASFILRSLDAGTSPNDLATALHTHYGIDRATALRDVELCLNDLAALESLDQHTS